MSLDIYTRDGHEFEDIGHRLFENPTVAIESVEKEFRSSLRSMTNTIVGKKAQIVLLCGPSSSGKTTTANLLTEDLSAMGRRALRISLDDFYGDRKNAPHWEDGSFNFETVEALDYQYFKECTNDLLTKGEAVFPIFSFTKGRRLLRGRKVSYDEDTILIFEGIHALNPKLRDGLKGNTIGIYIHPNTNYMDDKGNIILDARDLRLTRRIIRDYLNRGYSAKGTIDMWEKVLRGELLYMKPDSAYADVEVNTSHDYEPFLYKDLILPLLDDTLDWGPHQELVDRLQNGYNHFFSIDLESIPKTSLIQEFISVGK